MATAWEAVSPVASDRRATAVGPAFLSTNGRPTPETQKAPPGRGLLFTSG
jgi:hypothetical protein